MKKPYFILIFVILLLCVQCTSIYANTYYCWNCGKLNDRATTRTCSICNWNKCSKSGCCSYDCPNSKKIISNEPLNAETIIAIVLGAPWVILIAIAIWQDIQPYIFSKHKK